MNKWLYTVEYYDDNNDRTREYIVAKDDDECMTKFAKHHPFFDDYVHIVNWQRIDY